MAEFEGVCVCGQKMRKISEHLNYVVWKCESCGRREPRWKGARPHSLSEASKQELAECSIFNNIEKVINGNLPYHAPPAEIAGEEEKEKNAKNNN